MAKTAEVEKKIVRIDNPQKLVGMPFSEAKKIIEDSGYSYKLERYTYLVSVRYRRDYDPLRVNLVVESEKVIAAYIG